MSSMTIASDNVSGPTRSTRALAQAGWGEVWKAPAFAAGTPRLLVDRNASDFAEAPDAASPGRPNVVVNWFEELRRH